MSDIAEISRGRVISKDYLARHSGSYPVYSSQTQNHGVFGYIDNYDYDIESITWTTDGANAGSVFHHRGEKFSITNVCGLLRVKEPQVVSTRYLFHQLSKVALVWVTPSRWLDRWETFGSQLLTLMNRFASWGFWTSSMPSSTTSHPVCPLNWKPGVNNTSTTVTSC